MKRMRITHVFHHGRIVGRVEDEGSDQVRHGENQACDARVAQPYREKRVRHVDEEANGPGRGQRAPAAMLLRPERQMHVERHLEREQRDQHYPAHPRQPDLVHPRSGYSRDQCCNRNRTLEKVTRYFFLFLTAGGKVETLFFFFFFTLRRRRKVLNRGWMRKLVGFIWILLVREGRGVGIFAHREESLLARFSGRCLKFKKIK